MQTELHSIQTIEPVKIIIFKAVLDYYISIIETNYNKRNKDSLKNLTRDINFIRNQFQLSPSDFLHTIIGFMIDQPEQFKRHMLTAIDHAKDVLKENQDIQKTVRMALTLLITLTSLAYIAVEDKECTFGTLFALGFNQLAIAFINNIELPETSFWYAKNLENTPKDDDSPKLRRA